MRVILPPPFSTRPGPVHAFGSIQTGFLECCVVFMMKMKLESLCLEWARAGTGQGAHQVGMAACHVEPYMMRAIVRHEALMLLANNGPHLKSRTGTPAHSSASKCSALVGFRARCDRVPVKRRLQPAGQPGPWDHQWRHGLQLHVRVDRVGCFAKHASVCVLILWV